MSVYEADGLGDERRRGGTLASRGNGDFVTLKIDNTRLCVVQRVDEGVRKLKAALSGKEQKPLWA